VRAALSVAALFEAQMGFCHCDMNLCLRRHRSKPDAKVRWRALDEIDAGVCDGLTYAQIAERFPDEFAARKADKLRYRWVGQRGCAGARTLWCATVRRARWRRFLLALGRAARRKDGACPLSLNGAFVFCSADANLQSSPRVHADAAAASSLTHHAQLPPPVPTCTPLHKQLYFQVSPSPKPKPNPPTLNPRYPRGESYLDMIQRLEPVMLEMEREAESLVIVSHQAVLRVIFGWGGGGRGRGRARLGRGRRF
jgi:broad specificity phosphatase PhoE